MTARQKPPAPRAALVWERPERAARPTPGPLSRDRIVGAALTIADREGLAAVSLRRVGAALNAGPMRLYGYLATKEELLELMVDAVYGEMAAMGPIHGDWRESLRLVAERTRHAARVHKWFIDLLSGRPHMGPSALAHLESSLAALASTPGFENIDTAMLALGTVNAYVLGAIQSEASELRAEHESGMNQTEWQNASAPYLYRMLATGRYPTLAKVVKDATHPPHDVVFARGLDCVLDGIAARIPR